MERKEGETTTLFVQNIPPRYRWRGLRKLFGRHEDVVSSFIVRKYDRAGKRFGFDSFSNMNDVDRAVLRLNGLWILGYRLTVKEARIAEQWGEFLAIGENALQERGCGEVTVLIATDRKESIDEVLDLEVGGGCLSGEDVEERNIGEEAIMGLRTNDDGSGIVQKRINYEVENVDGVEVIARRWQRQKGEAKKTLQIGRALGIEFEGPKDILVREIVAVEESECVSQLLSIAFN
ncbi:hypothetical protein F3Y22_tig00113096pilonHSYRG00215 [Hibiscus syriacus]|uniref:RRM domain-containing protein n=1 Tax=Hibiscus syriacus TaxID=106335 RepID=A0A6A2X3F2_HIBSY|nr:hypothetical protein F3Y22_tig00113096pilonHSYRG00215 [Hibiscus syriacus]